MTGRREHNETAAADPPVAPVPSEPAISPAPRPAAPPDSSRVLFGDRLFLAEQYASLLASDGVAHGHIGPREVPRLWQRHLDNCAVVADLLPHGVRVLDVGSGAGLPGLPLAIRRPDLQVTLLEPMLRRCEFLARAVDRLGLDEQVTVVRGRAEERASREVVGDCDWIVARAVAPLDRLVGWCLPLLAPRGRMLALKGKSAATELAEHRAGIARRSGGAATLVELCVSGSDERTWVVSVQRQTTSSRTRRRAR